MDNAMQCIALHCFALVMQLSNGHWIWTGVKKNKDKRIDTVVLK